MEYFLIATDLLLLVLFARLFAADDDRNWIFNPYLLWTGRVTGPMRRFANDLVPGISERATCGVTLLFLLVFRGALMKSAGETARMIPVGETFVFLQREGWYWAIAFSFLRFATFLAHFWGFSLLCGLLARPGEARARVSQALDAFAAPFSSAPLWARTIAVVAANVLLAVMFRYLADSGIPNLRTPFSFLFHVDTPARAVGAVAGIALMSLADSLNFACQALLVSIFASLFAAIVQNRTLAAFFMELQNVILGRFSRLRAAVGALDFTPIIFFVAISFAHSLAISVIVFAMRRLGIIAAGALAAQPY